jgi:hypothetical protein
VVDNLEALRLCVANSNKMLRFFRADNEFASSLSKAWVKTHDIQFQPSIPFAHNIIHLHKTSQETIIKALVNKSKLTLQIWGLAYLHCVHIHNILPNHHTGKSHHPFDFSNFPLLLFGSIFMGNVPTKIQISLLGRSRETYFVECSDLHH